MRDPIHGYIHLTDVEINIIDTPIFQRLRRIRQLAGAHLTYPGAQHSRFEHMVGCCHLAGLVSRTLKSITTFNENDSQELRLAALLHDVGHGPFSHIFEEVLVEKKGNTHEHMTQKIIMQTEISDILERHGHECSEMSKLSVALSETKPQYVNDAVGGGLSVDSMDYLLRDSYFTGVEYGKVDVHRLIESLEVVEDKLALDQAALYAFEALAIARYEMFRAVYFHRSVRAGEVMLIRAMKLADEELGLSDTDDIGKYLELTDESVLLSLIRLESRGNKDLTLARNLAIQYRDRKLMKCVFERLVQGKDRVFEHVFIHEKIRDQMASEIAKSAGVDPESIYIDVSATPSVPYTSKRQSLSSVTLVSKTFEGKTYESRSIEEFPLLKEITGFMDILRIYSQPEHRSRVEKAVKDFFDREDLITNKKSF